MNKNITGKENIKVLPISFSSVIKLTSLFMLVGCFENCMQSKNQQVVKEESGPLYYTMADFKTVEKYDAHVHVNTNKETFLKQAEEDNFHVVTINWDDVNDPPPMEEQQQFALRQIKAFPGRITYATTFSIRNFNNDKWQGTNCVIEAPNNCFLQGAVAVKNI